MCRGGGSRAQGLVRVGVVVPTTPQSLERVRREMSRLLVVLCRNQGPGGQYGPFAFCAIVVLLPSMGAAARR